MELDRKISARDASIDTDAFLAPAACDYNGCKCAEGTSQGQYCAGCWQVLNLGRTGDWDHVYECNPRGGCCDYGYARDCARGRTGRCG